MFQTHQKKNLVKKNTPEKKVASQEGAYIPDGRYVTIKKANYTIWASFSWAEKSHSRNYLNQTLQARGRYEHKNGSTYLSLYNTSGAWIGYINASGTEKVNGPQGNYISDGRYVTLKGGEYKLWNNFNWQPRSNSNQYLNQTFQARGRYQHFNGGTYLSLYNNQGNWMGYININGTSIANGAQGAYINDGRYVTMTQNNYSLWSSFSWSKKAVSSRYLNQTLQAKGRYEHFNGATYYSLYNNQDEWLGYINANAMTVADGRQGIYQHYGKKVTLIKRNYSMWSSFSWNERHKTSAFVNQSFIARGKYNHFNGGTYLSLYDSQGKWYGYLNQSAVSLDAEKMDRVQGLLNAKYHSPNYGIYVTSLADGSSASANGSKNFVAASTGKLPAMYYTQKMINEKKVDPHKKRLYTDAINQMNGYSYQRGGAGILQGKPLGSYYSLDTMLNWTAKYSDNQGANFLGYYGTNKYDATMRREISAIIGRTWHSPFQITAKENAMLIRAMYYQGGQVMGYMQNTVYDNQRIPRDLPVKVAHKIGDVGSYRHDVAVIYTETPYVLSVMTQNYTSYDTISKLSNEIYEIMK
ncbi:serine hydrolase [Vagococcus penaei]|uniref:serine hydrolase n=1 Tax=Vagococcus penaei TaxID=633807 RepID=UPI00147658CE|nr:serine hydrolase [Vagococcus penaei]